MKGLYDQSHDYLKALVTGSARLDIYQKRGDSLLGRYFLHHLYPFTMGELTSQVLSDPVIYNRRVDESADLYDKYRALFRWGGFPEPLFATSEQQHRRWSIQRNELLVREDIRDLTQINHLTLIEHLMLLLPSRVSSILSINSLKEDLKVAYNTVKAWLETLEKLYVVYQLSPYTEKVHRSIQKEKKLYLWDWSQVEDEGDRFENMVASHLVKACQIWKDLGFGNYKLHFLRDRYKQEVDFCVTKANKPVIIIEAKLAETKPTEALCFFSKKFNIPALQVIHKQNVYSERGLITVTSAAPWLATLP